MISAYATEPFKTRKDGELQHLNSSMQQQQPVGVGLLLESAFPFHL
jgi:hypothetical protein